VTAVLVSHDGARWLPEVLDALAAQTRKPERFVAADTDSADGSARIITDTLGPGTVVAMPRNTAFGDAVAACLEAFAGTPLPVRHEGEPVTEWIWLLHDDCAPEPQALDELLSRVVNAPSVWMVGPKVRAWDGVRLLEAGLTIDATGNIDTGIDGVELDQGQRDDIDEVLAVGTAGALIRRDAWERLGGLDPAWSTYADDVDLGWRINAAGGRVIVASRAVVRHVRAQTIGRRSSAIQAGAPAVVRRRSGMQVVLSNTSPVLVPLLLLRYAIGGLLRALGFLVISRRPSQAIAEVRATASVVTHPKVVTTGRRDRSRLREVPHRDLRHLFPSGAGRWRASPLRIGGLGTERVLPIRSGGGSETGPVSEEAESLNTGDSAVAAFLRRPGTVLFVLMSVLALVAERHVLGTTLHGGRLLPAPNGSSDLWSTYTASFHPTSVGSTVPAPPSLAILALLSTILLGKAWLAVDLIVLGAVPFAAVSAYTAARGLTGAVRVRIWVAIVYSLLPAVTGAIAGGRIDVAAVAILLPWLLRASINAVRRGASKGGWKRSLAAGLLLAVTVAFAPILWLVAVPAFIVGIGFYERESEQSATLGRLGAAVVMLLVPLAALVPWTWHVIAHPRLLINGMGLPELYTSHNAPSGISLALLHAGGSGEPPFWIGVPIIAAALLGLNRQSRVAVARLGSALLIIGVGVAIAMTRSAAVTSGVPASRHWPGLLLLVAGAGALLSALVAAVGARPALREQAFGWRQPAAVGVVALAIASTVVLLAGWVIRGAGAPLTDHDPQVLPLFTQSELDVRTSPRALVINSTGPEISFALVRRAAGPRLGDADTAPTLLSGTASTRLAAAVRDLVAGRPGAGAELVPFDVAYIVAATDTAREIAPALGQTPALRVVPAPDATVWRSSLRTGELTILGPVSAARVVANATTANVARVLAAKPGSADVTIPAGVAGRLVVLAEPADGGWHASVDGHALQAKTAYGWAQGFLLPTSGGRLTVGYSSGDRDLWLVGQLVVVVILVGAMLPGRRPDDTLEAGADGGADVSADVEGESS
jgi:GT2 family glycosyltransferase